MSTNDPSRVDRRTTLKWVAALMVSSAGVGCGDTDRAGPRPDTSARADLGTPRPVTGPAYGTDPDLMAPTVPWERTMTEAQLALAATLADMILPADDISPAASEVGVADFIDEWVSAPYAAQQADRETVFAGLDWLEQEALSLVGGGFVHAGDTARREILDRIAWPGRVAPELTEQARFFSTFRGLAMNAFYASEAGMADIGYLGNQPMSGAYPGPTPEALAHLEQALAGLGLAMPQR